MEIIFFYTDRTVPKSNSGIVETEIQSMTITHIYMTTHFPGLVQALL